MPLRAIVPTAAGVAATYLTVLASCVVVARGFTHPLILWLGLAAPLCFLFSAGSVLSWIAGHPLPLTAEDESRPAAAIGVHPGTLIAYGLVVALVTSG